MGRETFTPPAAATVGSATDLLVRNAQAASVARERECQNCNRQVRLSQLFAVLGSVVLVLVASSWIAISFILQSTTWRECRRLQTSEGENANSVDLPAATRFITVDSRLRGLVRPGR
jgi:hypothetical protein